jgi:hypothetical protein
LRVTRVWANGGYTGRLVDFARGVLRVALTVVRRSDDTSGFTVLVRVADALTPTGSAEQPHPGWPASRAVRSTDVVAHRAARAA